MCVDCLQSGEPMANYNRVREAIRRMVEVMGISARSITVSTVGIVPGIKRLADEPWPVYLAISLPPPTTSCAHHSCRSTSDTQFPS
jgi:adenine C2-methylase RlmN of 23S rRNA A2503 and tRNA A37